MHDIMTGISATDVAISAYWFAVVAHHMKDMPSKEVTQQYGDGFVWIE